MDFHALKAPSFLTQGSNRMMFLSKRHFCQPVAK
jgi:hypothetical protein